MLEFRKKKNLIKEKSMEKMPKDQKQKSEKKGKEMSNLLFN